MIRRMNQLRKPFSVMAVFLLIAGMYMTLFPVQPLGENVTLSTASPMYVFRTDPFLLPEEVTFVLPSAPSRLNPTPFVVIQDCGDTGLNLTVMFCPSGSDTWGIGGDIGMNNVPSQVTIWIQSRDWIQIALLSNGFLNTTVRITTSYPAVGVPLAFGGSAFVAVIVVPPVWLRKARTRQRVG